MGCYVENSNDGKHGENSSLTQMRHANSYFQEYPKTSKENNVVPEKVLIFSQFLEHIHVIEQQVVSMCHIFGLSFVVHFQYDLIIDFPFFLGS